MERMKETLRLGPNKFTVHFVEQPMFFDEPVRETVNLDDGRIEIAAELPKHIQLQLIWHALIHIFLNGAGRYKMDDQTIQGLAMQASMTMSQSPKFYDELRKLFT